MSLLSDIPLSWQRDSHITTVSLLKIIFKNDLVIKKQPKPKLEMHTHSLYRTSDFSVLHTTLYKQALQTLNVNFITLL